MGRYKKAGYIFWTSIGDHAPRHVHVHVYDGTGLILKWNLDEDIPMKGKITKKIRKALDELIKEGKL